MTTQINGRTPQTIKKRVGCWNAFRQRKCPAAKDITFQEPGACKNCALRVPGYTIEQAMVDILEYAEQLERERDAAVEAAHGVCKACIHFNGHYPPGDIMSCCKFEECLYGMDEWDAEDHWQWRGVQKKEDEKDVQP